MSYIVTKNGTPDKCLNRVTSDSDMTEPRLKRH